MSASGTTALRYAFQLTESEHRAVVLFSMLRRPGSGFRRFMAIAVGGIALTMGFQQPDAGGRVLAVTVALACGFLALRPFFLARVLSRQPRPDVKLTLDERGITIRRGDKEATFEWTRITGQGRGPGFYWYEIQGAAIAAIPDRVIEDRPALEAMLARADKKPT